jgi:uncharacterized Zn-finger protein
MSSEVTCHLCDRQYKSKAVLASHIRQTDNWDKSKYKCEFCPKEYKFELTLKDHIKEKHDPDAKLEPCSLCDNVFKTANKLKTHVKAILKLNVVVTSATKSSVVLIP